MRITLAHFAILALFVSSGFGQNQEKTFYFTQPTSPAELAAAATMIRTVVDVQSISVDKAHQALILNGPVDKLVTTEWLFQQLNQPTVPSVPATSAPQYKMSGENGEIVTVFRLAPTTSIPDMTALVTAIRTVADLQRLFPYQAQTAIVARGTADKVAAAAWLVQQLCPADGPAPTTDSPSYPVPASLQQMGADAVIQIFRMDPSTTNQGLTSMVTAMRTTADLRRLFPFETGKAIIASGSADQIAVAGWLIHELGKPSHPQTTHQTNLAGVSDGVVRVFYVGDRNGLEDLTTLVAQIRTTADIQRIYPLTQPGAVVLRGRPDQMSTVESIVTRFSAGAQ